MARDLDRAGGTPAADRSRSAGVGGELLTGLRRGLGIGDGRGGPSAAGACSPWPGAAGGTGAGAEALRCRRRRDHLHLLRRHQAGADRPARGAPRAAHPGLPDGVVHLLGLPRLVTDRDLPLVEAEAATAGTPWSNRASPSSSPPTRRTCPRAGSWLTPCGSRSPCWLTTSSVPSSGSRRAGRPCGHGARGSPAERGAGTHRPQRYPTSRRGRRPGRRRRPRAGRRWRSCSRGRGPAWRRQPACGTPHLAR
jgi:hypothetical protein